MSSRSGTRQQSGDTLVQKYIKAFAIGFVGFSLTCAVTPARVQFAHPRPLTLADAMQRCAALFKERNVRKVAVADFAATGMPADNRLGQKLAADFRHDLASAAPQLNLVSEEQILAYGKPFNLAQEDLLNEDVAKITFQKTDVEGWVTATIEPVMNGSAIALNFTVHTVKPPQDENFNASLNLTPELSALIDPAPPDPTLSYGAARPGEEPHCVYCPGPPAPHVDKSLHVTLKGAVLLRVVVLPTGQIGDIHVLRGMPLGLTQQAINAVRQWRLTPAHDADGEPMPVVQTISVSF